MADIKPRILTKEAFLVIGPAMRLSTENEQNIKRIPLFWEEVMQKNLMQQIPNAVNKETSYGLCMDYDKDRFTYMIAMEVDSLDSVPDDMIGRTIPEATYAVFTARGPIVKAVQDTVRFIYSTWFPESGYEHAMTPEFELYDERCHVEDEESSEVDIYIPVNKKD